jgi:menaquinone-dependent protoporphyrinogen IX oxidase
MAGRTLVAYHTKGGATETYAKVITETLEAQGIQTDLVNLREKKPDVTNYDNIIVGTGVRMFMVYGKWKKILKQKSLAEKKLFMFLSSGMAIDDPEQAAEKFLRPIVNKYTLSPISMVSFPGMIPEKMTESDKHRDSVKPEIARKWASEIMKNLKEAKL